MTATLSERSSASHAPGDPNADPKHGDYAAQRWQTLMERKDQAHYRRWTGGKEKRIDSDRQGRSSSRCLVFKPDEQGIKRKSKRSAVENLLRSIIYTCSSQVPTETDDCDP